MDFDRWRDQDQDEEEEMEEMEEDGLSSEDFLRTKYPDAYKELQKAEMGYVGETPKKVYLFMYNMFMFCGFLYVVSVLTLRYSRLGEDFVPTTWNALGNLMKMLHLMMVLEILHPLFGYTKGSVVEAAMQIGFRNFVLLLLIDAEPRMQEKPVVFYIFIIYSVIELVRYPYYMLRVTGVDVGLITWLRYTLWIPLYPAGFICEGVIMLRNIPYFEETEKFSVSLPNEWNFAFHFPSLLRVYLLFFFFPALYAMMNHMYNMRCKKLGVKKYRGNKKND